ncbi:MAG: CinA family protein [Gammaproteobacteria bacterium]
MATTPPTEVAIPDDQALWTQSHRLGQKLLAGKLKLAVAESCTGGWIAKALTDVPGSSEWFEAGLVTYSNAAKVALLGVSPETLDVHGAVSEAVVLEMTAGARRATGADAAIAVSGIAGPYGDTSDKPVGLVHLAWSLQDRDWSRSVQFSGDREAVRRQSVELAITTLRDALTD